MGAKPLNQNAKKDRTRVSIQLSISDDRLKWALDEIAKEDVHDPSDSLIAQFVRRICYEYLDKLAAE